jgi:hypothetical protein
MRPFAGDVKQRPRARLVGGKSALVGEASSSAIASGASRTSTCARSRAKRASRPLHKPRGGWSRISGQRQRWDRGRAQAHLGDDHRHDRVADVRPTPARGKIVLMMATWSEQVEDP